MDFLRDQLSDGRTARIPAAIATFSRSYPAPDSHFAHRAHDVVETLDRAGKVVGCPKTMQADIGPGFAARDLDPQAHSARSPRTTAAALARGPNA